MAGTSTDSSRRLPSSVSSSPMAVAVAVRVAEKTNPGRARHDDGASGAVRFFTVTATATATFSVVARDGLDGVDDLLVGHLVGGPGEAGVLAVHQQGQPAVGVAPQGGDQLPALGLVQRAEVHVTVLHNGRSTRAGTTVHKTIERGGAPAAAGRLRDSSRGGARAAPG